MDECRTVPFLVLSVARCKKLIMLVEVCYWLGWIQIEKIHSELEALRFVYAG